MLSEDGESVADVYLHIADGSAYVDTNPPEIYEVPEEHVIDTDSPIIEWNCEDGNCMRPAEILEDAGIEFPYTGSDKTDFFETERCFSIPFTETETTFQKGSEKKT